MFTLGPIGFLQPWLLLGLLSLPVIWWLLRFTPPRPQHVKFPPTRLLKDLESKTQTPAHSPWWLTAIRILVASMIIAALSGPLLNPEHQSVPGSGPMVIVVDNGWASAKNWTARKNYVETLVTRAERESRLVAVVPTAVTGQASEFTPGDPKRIRELAGSLNPQPFQPNRLERLEELKQNLNTTPVSTIIWLSDGLNYGTADEFANGLKELSGDGGQLVIVRNNAESGPLGIRASTAKSGELAAEIIRSKTANEEKGVVLAWSGRGAQLGEADFTINAGKSEATALIKLPLELRNQVTRLEIAGERSAGAVHLLDSRSQRKRIGLVSGESGEQSQPLLSPLYYIERALSPFTDIISSKEKNTAIAINDLLKQKPSSLILADIGNLVGETLSEIDQWVAKGGVLIRFAGPRLEKANDTLLPVTLRQGGRTLGGALSWSTPQQLAPFEETSIFNGLAISREITVNRQVLADPSRTRENSFVWARLQDGTPLVTAAKYSEGWLILFHVTANSQWSNLPLSGLFVEMLERLSDLSSVNALPLSQDSATTKAENVSSDPVFAQNQILTPFQTLDGFGRLVAPPPWAKPIDIKELEKIRPQAEHPPGYYGSLSYPRAINIIGSKTNLKAYTGSPEGATLLSLIAPKSTDLKPWLLLAALALFLIDAVAVIIMSGGNGVRILANRAVRIFVAAAFTGLGTLLMTPPAVSEEKGLANDQFALNASLKTRLAYVLTGDKDLDNASLQGLDGLSRVISARTAVEPAKPIGVDITRDELAFFPLLYWPVRQDAQSLPEETLARIDAYMKQGGLIIFDTRDYQMTLPSDGSGGPGAKALQRLLGRLDIPRLEPVPEGHVLTKSFYLLRNFPGRWDGGILWVEAQQTANENDQRRARRSDGVSSIIVTSNDFASAWALDEQNRPMFPVVPGGEVQREMSYRSGINIVMYALTGNYKADQVHVPALLERLGQ